jgi:membrane protease YdiL (CAAX protease family)
MDPDALNDEGLPGTGRRNEPAHKSAQKVLDFLKTQAFYLAVVILVVALGGMKTWKELCAQEESLRTGRPLETAGLAPLLQRDFETAEKDRLTAALTRPDARCHRAAAFAEAVESLKSYLFWGGCVVVAGIGLSWVLRGRRAARPAASDPPWGLWDVAKLAALWAAGSVLLHTKWFFPLNPESPYAVPGDWVAELFIVMLLVGATIHIAVGERQGHLRDLGIRGKFLGGIAIGLTAFLAVQPFLGLVAALEERAAHRGWIPQIPVQEVLQAIAKTRSGWVLWLAAIVAVVAAPISEELLFRGFLQPALGRWTGRRLAIILSAAFFAAAHMDLYAMPMLLVLGIALAYVYDRTQSLVAPVALHMAFNSTSLLSVFAFRGLVSALSAPP